MAHVYIGQSLYMLYRKKLVVELKNKNMTSQIGE
jgi:hypothetical protein